MNYHPRVQRVLDAQKALDDFIGRAVVVGQDPQPGAQLDANAASAFEKLNNELRDAVADLIAHRGEE